jgi:hypothetical protein
MKIFSRLSLKIIEEAKLRYEKSNNLDEEQSVLFKLMQKDTRYATVMAFDMIFGGIDTVSESTVELRFS